MSFQNFGGLASFILGIGHKSFFPKYIHCSFLLVLLSILLLFVFKFAVACFLQTYTGWLDIGVEQLLFIGKLCQIIACQSYTECMSLGKMKTAHGHEEPLEKSKEIP